MIIGQQVLYRPNHIGITGTGNTMNGIPVGCELGFVTNTVGDYAYCRFWKPFKYPMQDERFEAELRTKSNSEMTPMGNLVLVGEILPQFWIETMLNAGCWDSVFAEGALP